METKQTSFMFSSCFQMIETREWCFGNISFSELMTGVLHTIVWSEEAVFHVGDFYQQAQLPLLIRK